MTTEHIDALSISTVIGGQTPRNRGWVEAIRALRRDIIVAREGVISGINIDVEFHIPGNHFAPDYEGIRTSTFRKAHSLLKLQVALPPTAPLDPRPVLIEFMWASLDAVDAWALAKHRSVDTGPLRGIVAAVEGSDGWSSTSR
ncbi:MAG TPA: hypothetical protein VFT01_00485 [Homoserinimonas sp.]|nr:hypothetical protein [Homoserinimonas sp.]